MQTTKTKNERVSYPIYGAHTQSANASLENKKD